MIDTTIIFFSYFQASSIHYIFWLFEFSSCPLHACIHKRSSNDGHTTLKYPIRQYNAPHKSMVPRKEYFRSWGIEGEIHKKCRIDKLSEDIAHIAPESKNRYTCADFWKDDDIEEVGNTKSDDTRDSYTQSHAKNLVIRSFIWSKKLARRKMCSKIWKESQSDNTSESDTIDTFCGFFPPDLDHDIIDRKNDWEEKYRYTHLEFFDEYGSKSEGYTFTNGDGFDTKYLSKEDTKYIEPCEYEKFCLLGGSFVRFFEKREHRCWILDFIVNRWSLIVKCYEGNKTLDDRFETFLRS